MHKLLLLSLLAFSPLAANASMGSSSSRDAFAPDKGLDMTRSFEEQRQGIIKALDDGKTYREISTQDKQAVRASLDHISYLLRDGQSVERLSETTKVEVFNEQEKINTLLTQARADSRLICRREKVVGSNRPISHCMTVAERRRAREGGVEFLERMPHSQAQDSVR